MEYGIDQLDELAQQPAESLYVLRCMGYQGQFWNEPSGYGTNPAEAKIWTRDEAIAQIRQGHERREVAYDFTAYLEACKWFVARCATKRAATEHPLAEVARRLDIDLSETCDLQATVYEAIEAKREAYSLERLVSSELGMNLEDAERREAEIRLVLEDALERTPDPARSTLQLAREVQAMLASRMSIT